jgi:hypothetical protein
MATMLRYSYPEHDVPVLKHSQIHFNLLIGGLTNRLSHINRQEMAFKCTPCTIFEGS